MIDPQWLELPMSRTSLHGPKDVRVIEGRLYLPHDKMYSLSVRTDNWIGGDIIK